jgi:hypothetical protein
MAPFSSCAGPVMELAPDIKITRIAGFGLYSQRNKTAGKNAVKGVHGSNSRDLMIRVYTNAGVDGIGHCRADANAARQMVGKSLKEIHDAGHNKMTGTLGAGTMALWDVAGKITGKPVYELLDKKWLRHCRPLAWIRPEGQRRQVRIQGQSAFRFEGVIALDCVFRRGKPHPIDERLPCCQDVATKLEFAEPWKDLGDAKTMPLRPDTGFRFLNVVEVVEFRVRQRLDLRYPFQCSLPTVEGRFKAGIVQGRVC